MKHHTVFIVIGMLSGVSGCNESSSTASGPGSQEELILNGSFEQGGAPSLTGWKQSYPDTAFAHFSTDVPAGGGSYSLSLLNTWGPLPDLQATVPAAPGLHHFRLTFYSKETPAIARQFASGIVSIAHKTVDSLVYRKWIGVSDSDWTGYTLLDTILAAQGDSIIVSLAGGQTQWSFGQTLFDLVSFLKLD